MKDEYFIHGLIDPNRIGKGDAACPECGADFGKFLPGTDKRGPRLICASCNYQGKVVEFVGHKKWQELIRKGV
jgi:ribosomal protein S27AE